MPIDFVSGVIAATAATEREGFNTYHVVNPHRQDGVSLDRIMDWVQSAGFKVIFDLAVQLSCMHRTSHCTSGMWLPAMPHFASIQCKFSINICYLGWRSQLVQIGERDSSL